MERREIEEALALDGDLKEATELVENVRRAQTAKLAKLKPAGESRYWIICCYREKFFAYSVGSSEFYDPLGISRHAGRMYTNYKCSKNRAMELVDRLNSKSPARRVRGDGTPLD